jgi:hypothetical protein
VICPNSGDRAFGKSSLFAKPYLTLTSGRHPTPYLNLTMIPVTKRSPAPLAARWHASP